MTALLRDGQLTVRGYALLALLAALVFWPGQAQLPAIDRDEARFAQATKQMVETGDYADIRFQHEHRYKKPVGIYWLQAAAVRLTGAAPTDLWAYRLPSYLAAIGSVLLTAAIGTLLFGGSVGVLAALAMAGSLLLNVEARMAKTDAMLLFTILAAQFALLSLWRRGAHGTGLATLFWAALAAGILVKGPIILLPVGTTLAALAWQDRAILARLQPLWGVPLMLLLCAPWFIAITLKTGGAFWAESVGHDMLGKVAAGRESHGMPPGYYLVTFFATFWPFAPLAAMAAPAIWQRRREPVFRALLAWVIPTWLVFELVPTKLPHYTLPVFPAIAMLAAAAWHQGFAAPRWWKATCGIILAAVTVGLVAGFAALPYAASGAIAWPQIIAGILVIAGFALWARAAAPMLHRAAMASLLAALFLGTLFGITLPRWDYIWIARQTERAMATQADCASSPAGPLLASARFNEPSLVFHAGTATALDTDGTFAATYIYADACQFALVDTANESAFRAQAAALGITPHAIAGITGFSYGGGDRIEATLYRKERHE